MGIDACQVSVVIPVFNSAALVGTALKSVFAQTFRDFEVLVVDDGSDDGPELRAALAPWEGRLQYVRQANGGPASARNTAIRRASGRWIAFLDADDEWLPEKLERQVRYFERYPQTGLLHTAMLADVRQSPEPGGPPQARFCDLFHSAFFINTLTVMVPTQVFSDVGVFDERREIHIEDYDLWLRIAAKYPIGYIAEPLAYYRSGGMMSNQLDRTYVGQLLVLEKHEALCRTACPAHRKSPAGCLRARRHVLHRDWGYDRLASGDRKGARQQLARAIACAPWNARVIALYLSTFLSSTWRAQIRALTRARGSQESREFPHPADENVTTTSLHAGR